MSWLLLCSNDNDESITLLLVAESQPSDAGLMIESLKKRLNVYWRLSAYHELATEVDTILNGFRQCCVECFWENEAQTSGNARHNTVHNEWQVTIHRRALHTRV